MMRSAIVMLVVGGVASTARAQEALPTPYELVSQLDFECRPAHGPPVVPQLFVRQLNPVLQGRLPNLMVPMGELEEVCVPVAKNGQIPSDDALRFIRWMDLACYRAASPDPDVEVSLEHLNPVLAGLPDETVGIGPLEQVCVPVRKNDGVVPPQVLQMARHLDVACYGLDQPTVDVGWTLVLGHLNPVIRAMGLPNRVVDLRRAHQLCVPIAKNDEPVPPGVRAFVAWADFLKYRVVPHDPIPPLPLWLTHLNPLFAARPPFFTVLEPDRVRLMVPVAKDGHRPPGAGNLAE